MLLLSNTLNSNCQKNYNKSSLFLKLINTLFDSMFLQNQENLPCLNFQWIWRNRVMLVPLSAPNPVIFSRSLSHTHTHMALLCRENLMTRQRNHRSRKRKVSIRSLWLISISRVRNAFFASPPPIMLVYQPFRPVSLPLYFQLLEKFVLEVDQKNWVLLYSPGWHYKVMSWTCRVQDSRQSAALCLHRVGTPDCNHLVTFYDHFWRQCD